MWFDSKASAHGLNVAERDSSGENLVTFKREDPLGNPIQGKGTRGPGYFRIPVQARGAVHSRPLLPMLICGSCTTNHEPGRERC